MWLPRFALELLDSVCGILQYVSWLLLHSLQEFKDHQQLHNPSNASGTQVFPGRLNYLGSSQPHIPALHLKSQRKVEGEYVTHEWGFPHRIKGGLWRILDVCDQRMEGVVVDRHSVRLLCQSSVKDGTLHRVSGEPELGRRDLASTCMLHPLTIVLSQISE